MSSARDATRRRRPSAGTAAALLLGRLGLRRRRGPKPQALCLYVTYLCNMRCRMCGIWTRAGEAAASDLSLADLRGILSDPLFSELAFVNINGGEPNLRPDLADLAILLTDALPRLRAVSINSNGLPTEAAISNIRSLARAFRGRGIRFSVSVSLHGPGRSHDRATGTPGAYDRVMETLSGLRRLRAVEAFYLSVNCVITGGNLGDLEAMLEWGDREGIPVNFTLGEVRERFLNLGMERSVRVGDREALVGFLRRLSRDKARFGQHALRYAHLADLIEGRTRRALACHYALSGAILGSDGLLYYCKNSRAIGDARKRSAAEIYFDPANQAYKRDALSGEACPNCPPNTYNEIEVEHDLFKLAWFWMFGTRPRR